VTPLVKTENLLVLWNNEGIVGGRIIEWGSHEMLLLKGDMYAQLWQKQLGEKYSKAYP